MISGDVSVSVNVPADSLKAVADYEKQIANLDEMISKFEARPDCKSLRRIAVSGG